MPDASQTVMYCLICSERHSVLQSEMKEARCPKCSMSLAPIETGQKVSAFELIGQRLGGCRISSCIGQGAMGIVFKAIHEGLHREVAIKTLPVVEKRSGDLRRLVYEARIIAKLEHPNIVQVYDIGTDRGYVFIIMQLLDGITLDDTIKEGLIPLETALSITLQTTSAVGHAHAKGIVHRDLKPENIMILTKGGIKVMDFGLASDPDLYDELHDMVTGTPFYIAPEVWVKKTWDHRSDLYSLGVILYYILTGKRPFYGRLIQDLMYKHLKENPLPPSAINSNVPKSIDAIVRKLMAKEPEKRYQSADELSNDIELYLKGQVPKAVQQFIKLIKCPLCESQNSASLKRCKVCNELLNPEKPSL